MKTDETLYWVWLAETCGPASKDFLRLITAVPSPFEIFRMDDEELDPLPVSPRLKTALSEKNLTPAWDVLRRCEEKGIAIVTYADSDYPTRLRTLPDPPAVLYRLGEMPDVEKTLPIGIVGTRKISDYGRSMAYSAAYELAAAGCPIVSGFAMGVDAVAHIGALSAGGKTVAVLGCGPDIAYPKVHGKLRRRLLEENGGCFLSEYAPGVPPVGYNFPKRNRIISGLSRGVLVVEGKLESGAMITAETALSQGREVFAFPGKVGEIGAEGPNDLLHRGAHVALSAADLLAYYDFLYHATLDYDAYGRAKTRSACSPESLAAYGVFPEEGNEASPAPVFFSQKEKEKKAPEPQKQVKEPTALPEWLDETAKEVYAAMPEEPVTPDVFIGAGIGIAEAVTALTVLEVNGFVTSLPGGTYKKL